MTFNIPEFRSIGLDDFLKTYSYEQAISSKLSKQKINPPEYLNQKYIEKIKSKVEEY